MSNGERTTDFVKDLGEAVRENPVASALVGMGVAWLLFGRSFPQLGSVLGQVPGAARDSIGAAAGGLKSTMDGASRSVSNFGEAVGSSVSSAYAQVADVGSNYKNLASENLRPMGKLGMDVVDNTRTALAETFESQPLMLGVIGLAIGAGIAAALPTTDIEAAYLSETSGRVQEMAKDMASEQFASVVDRVQDVATAVASEAEKQGLTRDGVGTFVSDLSEKVSRVAKSATAGGGGV